MNDKINKSAVQLRDELTPEQYHVCCQKGTERPFTGKFYQHTDNGTYTCVCCDAMLFDSNSKFDSGTGWPSFWEAVSNCQVKESRDFSHGMARVEVSCANCGSHLGHVFHDGPAPTGLRYCINSASLNFKPRNSQ